MSPRFKWAFVDLEDLNIDADTETLPLEDLKKVVRLVRFCPMQFCLFLSALRGPEKMEQIMTEAIEQAKAAQEPCNPGHKPERARPVKT